MFCLTLNLVVQAMMTTDFESRPKYGRHVTCHLFIFIVVSSDNECRLQDLMSTSVYVFILYTCFPTWVAGLRHFLSLMSCKCFCSPCKAEA